MGKYSADFCLNFSEPKLPAKCCRLFNITGAATIKCFEEMKARKTDFKDNEIFFDIIRPIGVYFFPYGSSFVLFECTKLVDGKCSIYGDRPLVCKDYKFDEDNGCNYVGCTTEPVCNGKRCIPKFNEDDAPKEFKK